MSISRQQLEQLFSSERLSTYVAQCDGDFDAAVELYRWNAAVTAAFWEPIGHLEVALRNALSAQLDSRHRRLGRDGSWLDDPGGDLTPRARDDIAAARVRVKQKGNQASEGQTISELGFGFWRFLITKKLTGLWPDLASAFSDAPDRRRETVEEPLADCMTFGTGSPIISESGTATLLLASMTCWQLQVTSTPRCPRGSHRPTPYGRCSVVSPDRSAAESNLLRRQLAG